MRRAGIFKRVASVPATAVALGIGVSKADLLEVALSLAALSRGAVDDLDGAVGVLARELYVHAMNKGRRVPRAVMEALPADEP